MLQLLDVVAEPWGIGAGLLVAAQIILAFGFFATLVLAWYHGEQGRQRVSGPELLMLAALLLIAGAAIAFVRDGGEARSQVDIARQVADRLAASFTEREIERFEAGSTDDPLAYELYLRAMEIRNSLPAERRERMTLLRRALDRDPEFGLAWLGLSGAYQSRVADEGSEWADSARIAVERAVEYSEDPAVRLWLQSILAFTGGDPERAPADLPEWSGGTARGCGGSPGRRPPSRSRRPLPM